MRDPSLTGTEIPNPTGPPGPADQIVAPDAGQASLIRELVDLHDFTENVLRSMGSGLLATNGRGAVTHFNQRAADITGWAVGEALGRSGSEILRAGAGDLLAGTPEQGTRDGEVVGSPGTELEFAL